MELGILEEKEGIGRRIWSMGYGRIPQEKDYTLRVNTTYFTLFLTNCKHKYLIFWRKI